MFAKQQSLELAVRMEPRPLREVRKMISYEQGSFQKLGFLFCQLAEGLPRLDGKHITPERVRSLPYEYNDPHLQRVYLQLRRQHFPKRSDVDDYKVVWRDRPMATGNGPGTLRDTLGYIEFKTRIIHIGREMSHPDAIKWLPALIHHELCHAILVDFLTPTQDAHDEWFKRINRKHKDAPAFESWTGWRACFESYHKAAT
jgi:hypothetical protein